MLDHFRLSRDANTGAGQDLTGLASAFPNGGIRHRLVVLLQALQRCSGLLITIVARTAGDIAQSTGSAGAGWRPTIFADVAQ
jgi:hypothetical protein